MSELTMLAVGDVFVDRDDPSTAFHSARHLLATGDIVFGNCEGVFADDWERAPSSGSPVVAPAANAPALVGAGFDVLSLANNHSVDGGYRALLASRDTLRSLGAHTAGAGTDLGDAHAPAIVERGGVRVGVLAYTSVFPHGYEARAGTPGLAVLRAHTRYTPWELNEWNPGLLPKITTEPFEEDVERLRAGIAALREKVHVVLVSVHWGDFTRPFVLTDHERRIARLAIDAGADAVAGHHHHLLRGVEFHRGRPIFYGLGHYLFDLPNLAERLARDGYLGATTPTDQAALRRRFGAYRIAPRDGYPLLPFHPDSRMTGAAVLRISTSGVSEVGFLPARIDEHNEPVHAAADSAEGGAVAEYLQRCCDEEDLATKVGVASPESGLPAGSLRFEPTDDGGIR